MKKLSIFLKTLLAVAFLCVGQNVWGKAVTMRSWTFTGLDANTAITKSEASLTEAGTTCNLATAPSCCAGLYFYESWQVYQKGDSNPGLRNISTGDRMVIIPNLKKGDIITITGNSDAINNINTTKYTGTKDDVKNTLTFTMSADGNFYFKMVKSGGKVNDVTVYPSIKSIVVTHNYGNVYSADFEDAGTYANGWTIHSDLGPSQGTCTATSSKTLYMKNGSGSNRAFSYAYSDAIIKNASENNYIYEFDFNYGSCNAYATSTTLTIQSNNSAKKLFTIDKQSVAWSGEFKISNSSGTVLTETALAGGPYNNSTFPSLYHFMVEGIQDDGVYLTVTSGSSISLARTKVADFAPVTGLYSNMGKYMTAVAFDNIAYNIEIEGAKVRATAAIEAYNNIKNELMNSTAYSTLTSAYTTIAAYSTDEAIVADISGYITAIEALENAIPDAEESAADFKMLNQLIANANSSAPAGYVAPSGATAVYTENADVDAASLITAVRAAIITAGVANENTDITALIINNSFELGTTYGWTTIDSNDTGARGNSSPYTTSGIDGSWQFNTWQQGTPITQNIGTLPEGQYKLKCKVTSDNGNKIYLTVNDSHNSGTLAENGVEYVDAEFIFLLVVPTEVTIGAIGGDNSGDFTADGGKWYKADKFTLTYLGDGKTPYTINAVSGGSTIKKLDEGSARESETYDTYIPYVVYNESNGKYYVLDDAGNTALDGYHASYIKGGDAETKEINYTLDESIKAFYEGESLTYVGHSFYGTLSNRSDASNGKAVTVYNSSDNDGARTSSTISKDIYNISVAFVYWDDKVDQFKLQYSTDNSTWVDIATFSLAKNTNSVESANVSIPGSSYLRLMNQYAQTPRHSIDYILVKKLTATSATIGATGWTTFASEYPLDLSNMEASTGEVAAYYASAVGEVKVTMTSTESTGVAAGEGIMLKGTPTATITIPIAETGTAISGNLLKGRTSALTITKETENYASFYVLSNNGGTAEFQNLKDWLDADNSVEIPAGKAYLDATGAGARLSIVFDDDATSVTDVRGEMEEVGAYYNLQGQRVSQPAKGLYIMNGKKYFAK